VKRTWDAARYALLAIAACGAPPPASPADVACTLAGPWEYGQPDVLRLRDGGPAFATFVDPETAKLALRGATAHVELASKSLRVRGHVERAAVRLHPARAFVLGDALVPGPAAVLRPVEAKRDVVVELAPPRYMTARTVRGARACGDLALAERTFDPRAAISGDRETTDALAPDVAIPLAARAGGAPVGELRFTEAAPADVLERDGDRARVVLDPWGDPEADTFVVGWVPASALVAGPQGYSISDGRGGGRGGVRGRPRGTRHVACTHEVAFTVEQGGVRETVGAILPGAVISLLDEREVALDRIGLQLADGVRAFVDAAAVRDCAPAQP